MSQDLPAVMPDAFSELGLAEPLLRALDSAGYSEPTPIQARMIPHVLAGRDVVGQAQTGTGKTAAFALPLLNQLKPAKKVTPQVLVLAPTRELALQVSEAFKSYGANLKHLRVLPIFGGQEYSGQLQQLERGVQVIVGTPGRVMDHIRRGSLNLATIRTIVLDEADEMLKMGFLEDVEWILGQAPAERQIALFSATMPESIRRIAATYLTEPVEISIRDTTVTAATISQHCLIAGGFQEKRQALVRILEAEPIDGMLVFVRTKMQTVELAEYLADQGHSCAALNGDIAQSQRLRTVEQLKAGKIDILIATDVAARGLDVERVSHVVNFDVPFDPETYVHRIGRTGRAGRHGKAILFLAPREKGMLRNIERATRQKIEMIDLPTAAEINTRRIAVYKQTITKTMATDCTFFAGMIADYCREHAVSVECVAAALAKMVQAGKPLLLPEDQRRPRMSEREETTGAGQRAKKERRTRRPGQDNLPPEEGMDRYRIEVGEIHGVRPGNIVGAIANEADISSEYIGRISIFEEHSTVDLPYGMPHQILRVLQGARINGRPMRTRREEASGGMEAAADNTAPDKNRKGKGKKTAKAIQRKGAGKRGPSAAAASR